MRSPITNLYPAIAKYVPVFNVDIISYRSYVATQIWCLARLLPLMVGVKIPGGDPHWCNFLLMRTIMDYLFAPVLSPDCCGHLKELINDHHKSFTELYPSCSVIPKMHYMIHYPEMNLRYYACILVAVLIRQLIPLKGLVHW